MITSEVLANRPPKIKEVHLIRMTTGLSCNGDSVSVTAAMQPSIEEMDMGAIPGLPKVHLHNPALADEVGDDCMNRLPTPQAPRRRGQGAKMQRK